VDHPAFVRKYPLRPPAKAPDNEDEKRLLGPADGVLFLEKAPSTAPSSDRSVPRKKGDPGCHLWVFTQSERPYILEVAKVAPELQSGRAKHSNLTGGGEAACGGELWVDPTNDGHLYVNGCSGRYGPTSPEQLEDAVSVLREVGFRVTNFGWDADTGKPAMVLRS
jgi:hypothetical protein